MGHESWVTSHGSRVMGHESWVTSHGRARLKGLESTGLGEGPNPVGSGRGGFVVVTSTSPAHSCRDAGPMLNGPGDPFYFQLSHRLPLGFGDADGFAAVDERAGHLGAILIGGGGELASAMGTDKFDCVGRQLDVLRRGHHELFPAIGAVHHGVEKFLSCGESRGTVRAFKSKRHNESWSIFHTSR